MQHYRVTTGSGATGSIVRLGYSLSLKKEQLTTDMFLTTLTAVAPTFRHFREQNDVTNEHLSDFLINALVEVLCVT